MMAKKSNPPGDVMVQVSQNVTEFNGVIREMIEVANNVVSQPKFQEEYKQHFGDFNLISGLILEAIKHDELKPMSLGGPYLYKYREYFKKDGPDWLGANFEQEIDQNNPQRTALMSLLNIYKKIYKEGGFTEEYMNTMRAHIRKLLKFYSKTCILVKDYDFWPKV